MATATAPPPTLTPPPPRSKTAATAPRIVPTMGRPKAGTMRPPKLILNAVEGFGKTSCGCYTTKPIILMAKGETGYLTLAGAGRVPVIDTLTDAAGQPRCVETWQEALDAVDWMVDTDKDHKTLVLDALGGIERMCHQHVCDRDFGGDWGEKGFLSFHKGYDLAVGDWLQLLYRLDKLSDAGWTILLLSHSKVANFKNPLSADFDRYVADCHAKTWAVTVKWADAVLFGTFVAVAEKQDGRTKGRGGDDRVIYTQRRDAWDAKNRYGMAEVLAVPNDPSQIWTTIRSAIVAGQHVETKTKE